MLQALSQKTSAWRAAASAAIKPRRILPRILATVMTLGGPAGISIPANAQSPALSLKAQAAIPGKFKILVPSVIRGSQACYIGTLEKVLGKEFSYVRSMTFRDGGHGELFTGPQGEAVLAYRDGTIGFNNFKGGLIVINPIYNLHHKTLVGLGAEEIAITDNGQNSEATVFPEGGKPTPTHTLLHKEARACRELFAKEEADDKFIRLVPEFLSTEQACILEKIEKHRGYNLLSRPKEPMPELKLKAMVFEDTFSGAGVVTMNSGSGTRTITVRTQDKPIVIVLGKDGYETTMLPELSVIENGISIRSRNYPSGIMEYPEPSREHMEFHKAISACRSQPAQ